MLFAFVFAVVVLVVVVVGGGHGGGGSHDGPSWTRITLVARAKTLHQWLNINGWQPSNRAAILQGNDVCRKYERFM